MSESLASSPNSMKGGNTEMKQSSPRISSLNLKKLIKS